jgi:hypothetical protein
LEIKETESIFEVIWAVNLPKLNKDMKSQSHEAL